MKHTTPSRQIVVDTETTGMNQIHPYFVGHNIVEIGAVELIDRCITGREFHAYLNPNRFVDPEAFRVHGISDQFLKNKPQFQNISEEFFRFIVGAELIIHNAQFDVGFIDHEFSMLDKDFKTIRRYCKVTDTLDLSKKHFPGKRHSLGALCKRFVVKNSERTLHSALLDARLLAQVFLLMTSEQKSFSSFDNPNKSHDVPRNTSASAPFPKLKSRVVFADESEEREHHKQLHKMEKIYKSCVWKMHLRKHKR